MNKMLLTLLIMLIFPLQSFADIASNVITNSSDRLQSAAAQLIKKHQNITDNKPKPIDSTPKNNHRANIGKDTESEDTCKLVYQTKYINLSKKIIQLTHLSNEDSKLYFEKISIVPESIGDQGVFSVIDYSNAKNDYDYYGLKQCSTETPMMPNSTCGIIVQAKKPGAKNAGSAGYAQGGGKDKGNAANLKISYRNKPIKKGKKDGDNKVKTKKRTLIVHNQYNRKLYIAGQFPEKVARDNSDMIEFNAVGNIGIANNDKVYTLTRHNDALYAGGNFTGCVKYYLNGQWRDQNVNNCRKTRSLLSTGDTLYASGETINNAGFVMHYNANNNWQNLGNQHGFQHTVKKIIENQNTLYALHDNNVKRYDANNWVNLFGDNTFDSILQMYDYNDSLYLPGERVLDVNGNNVGNQNVNFSTYNLVQNNFTPVLNHIFADVDLVMTDHNDTLYGVSNVSVFRKRPAGHWQIINNNPAHGDLFPDNTRIRAAEYYQGAIFIGLSSYGGNDNLNNNYNLSRYALTDNTNLGFNGVVNGNVYSILVTEEIN